MSIPDKAVEAAARKHFSLQTQKLAWDELPPVMREKLRLDARGVLEAAEPYLTGKLWEVLDALHFPDESVPGYRVCDFDEEHYPCRTRKILAETRLEVES